MLPNKMAQLHVQNHWHTVVLHVYANVMRHIVIAFALFCNLFQGFKHLNNGHTVSWRKTDLQWRCRDSCEAWRLILSFGLVHLNFYFLSFCSLCIIVHEDWASIEHMLGSSHLPVWMMSSLIGQRDQGILYGSESRIGLMASIHLQQVDDPK